MFSPTQGCLVPISNDAEVLMALYGRRKLIGPYLFVLRWTSISLFSHGVVCTSRVTKGDPSLSSGKYIFFFLPGAYLSPFLGSDMVTKQVSLVLLHRTVHDRCHFLCSSGLGPLLLGITTRDSLDLAGTSVACWPPLGLREFLDTVFSRMAPLRHQDSLSRLSKKAEDDMVSVIGICLR